MAARSLGFAAAVGAVTALAIAAGGYLAFRTGTQPRAATATQAMAAPMPDGAGLPKAAVPQPAPTPATRKNARPDATRNTTPVIPVPAPAEAPAAATQSGATPVPPAEPPPPPAGVPVGETAAIPEPQKPRYDEVTVKADAVVGIRIDQTVTSETARVEDRVTASISRDVTVDGRTAIPAGVRLEGVVSMVERGGKLRERAKLGIAFNVLILSDGLRVPIQTDTIFREGDAPAPEAVSKIGASALIGAVLGAVVGGKKGAAIGTTAGAAGGTAAVMAGGRNEAAFASGALLTLRLTSPVVIIIERDPAIR